MNFVLRIKGFNLRRPLREIELVVVLDSHLFGNQINIYFCNGREFRADIFDELGAAFAVDAGDGNSSFHMGRWEKIVYMPTLE